MEPNLVLHPYKLPGTPILLTPACNDTVDVGTPLLTWSTVWNAGFYDVQVSREKYFQTNALFVTSTGPEYLGHVFAGRNLVLAGPGPQCGRSGQLVRCLSF